jgi:hypothetical protein
MAGTVIVTGTLREPELLCEFRPFDRHPTRPRFTLLDFIKSLPARRFDKTTKTWSITATGPDPEGKFERAGMVVDWSQADEAEFDGIESLNDLVTPLVRLTAERAHLLIRPRLLGGEKLEEALGVGLVWEKKRRRYRMSVAGLLAPGHQRGLIDIPEEAYEAAAEARTATTTPDRLDAPAAALGRSVRVTDDADAHEAVVAHLGTDIPAWFGLDLFPFQRTGALAAAAGHSFIADEPGAGKCLTPDTLVIANGTTARIGDLWDERAAYAYPDPDGDAGELIDLAAGEIRVPSLDASTATATTADASHLYRQRYRGPVHTITLGNGRSLTCTPRHRLWTVQGWKRADEIALGDRVGTPTREATTSVRWSAVTSNSTSDFDRHVYDFSVPGTRSYVAEGMWTHNTRQALAAASIHAPQRTLIVSPPVALTNWATNVRDSLLAHHAAYQAAGRLIDDLDGDGTFGDDTGFVSADTPCPDLLEYAAEAEAGTCVFVTGRKTPTLPDTGVVVVGDSTLAARPQLVTELMQWAPDVLIVDEIHRQKTADAERSLAVQKLAHSTTGLRIGMSGTPMLGSPVDLISPLSITGHLDPVFGSDTEFLTAYCRRNVFGAWEPQKRQLGELGRRIADRVWVRRTKAQVLPDLPKKLRVTQWVDVDLAVYKRTHGDVVTEFADRAEEFHAVHKRWPNKRADYEQIFGDPFTAMSPLRKAAGLAKVQAVADQVLAHLDAQAQDHQDTGAHNRPAIVWVHHQEVATRLREAMEAGGYGDATETITGGTSKAARDRIVDDFQAGRVAVLIASIQAANVAITLTRSCDVFFAERDWRAAQVSQAEDRALRIGQTRTVTSTTYLAAGTFDERIEGVLSSAGSLLEPVLTGGDNHVSTVEEADTRKASDILAEMVETAVAGRKRKLARLAKAGS